MEETLKHLEAACRTYLQPQSDAEFKAAQKTFLDFRGSKQATPEVVK